MLVHLQGVHIHIACVGVYFVINEFEPDLGLGISNEGDG
jgi:hypothetical protein